MELLYIPKIMVTHFSELCEKIKGSGKKLKRVQGFGRARLRMTPQTKGTWKVGERDKNGIQATAEEELQKAS